jgi:hypothetical protein
MQTQAVLGGDEDAGEAVAAVHAVALANWRDVIATSLSEIAPANARRTDGRIANGPPGLGKP